ncbi:prephenate dehydrogenase/arogenate dehydrogenase family protein [Bacillus pumilus]|uniref:prephenate dehydrogenase/arogenate dehydrogenase family protein n=1 Tax=Bacillus pumilus TaxID=1408 RepID=UPI00228164F2|nr:prephenate dehydrogenase/arogenate dehydrogenase family protein [Bacillus pumilus]MCY7575653.1 prephenate dehydrogenase/arogenate dehydrogenase family protein [Bacillus pumilus]
MKIGFIGYGEAAYELSTGLKTEGLDHFYAYDVLLQNEKLAGTMKEKAARTGVELTSNVSEVIGKSDIVIAAVPANKTLEVAQSVLDSLKKNQVYVDVSASTPDIKKQVANEIEKQEALFVDVAMLGSLPVNKQKVPITASGSGTDRFIELTKEYGMNITKISDQPGDASALKLIRSIYMKGIVGLLIEFLEISKKYNVEDQVISSLSETLDSKSFEETMNRLVTGSALHAKRRAVELLGSIEMLDSAHIDASMCRAAQQKLERLADFQFVERFNGEKPASWEEVIDVMQQG